MTKERKKKNIEILSSFSGRDNSAKLNPQLAFCSESWNYFHVNDKKKGKTKIKK